MNKIKKFLEGHGYKIKLIDVRTYQGKKCFANNGRYTEELYSVSKDGKEYALTNKITGQKFYMMYENNGLFLVAGGDSQRHFIEMFENNLDKEEGA
jgi:hypothetical protein